jgi:hypothetical protein
MFLSDSLRLQRDSLAASGEHSPDSLFTCALAHCDSDLNGHIYGSRSTMLNLA